MRILIVILLVGLNSILGTEAEKDRNIHAVFDRILRDTVREERVDYLRIRNRHADKLTGYLEHLAAVQVNELSRDGQLAFHINLYNAAMIQIVIDRYRQGYAVSENEFSVFDEPLVNLEGQKISLNVLEHEIIRPKFKDPRIHVALVCAAESCPPLLPRSYRAQDIDKVLERNMIRFLHDPIRNRIDPKTGRLEISQIFNWYAVDFGGKEALPEYMARYTAIDPGESAVSFLTYSWELNITPVDEHAR